MNQTNSNPKHKPSILQTRWFWGLAIGLTVILGGAWIMFSQTISSSLTGAGAAALTPAPIAGHPAPDFELTSLAGQVVRLSDFKGKAWPYIKTSKNICLYSCID